MLMGFHRANIQIVCRETILIPIAIMDDYVELKWLGTKGNVNWLTEGVLLALAAFNAVDRFRFGKGYGCNIIDDQY